MIFRPVLPKFQLSIQKLTTGPEAKTVTSIDYIQYILNGGTNFERKQFLECIEGQLYLQGGEVWLEKAAQSRSPIHKNEASFQQDTSP
ncbi:hypothetical protein IT413_03455 [Candidatus Peregrinibacteria bacterium]|nr:hypothetical protein [Candidatus Peregrinibacteria bacterium]